MNCRKSYFKKVLARGYPVVQKTMMQFNADLHKNALDIAMVCIA